MKVFGSWSIISFLRFCIQFIWAVLLVVITMQIAMLGLFTYSGGEVGLMLPVSLNSSVITSELKGLVESSSVVVTGSSIQGQYSPLSSPLFPGILLTLFQISLTALTFYGVTLLRRVLNEMHRTTAQRKDVFSALKGDEIRIVGILLLLVAPMKFLYEWIATAYFSRLISSSEIATALPPFDFVLLFAGLICFVIAEILNGAATLYEEQQLTV